MSDRLPRYLKFRQPSSVCLAAGLGACLVCVLLRPEWWANGPCVMAAFGVIYLFCCREPRTSAASFRRSGLIAPLLLLAYVAAQSVLLPITLLTELSPVRRYEVPSFGTASLSAEPKSTVIVLSGWIAATLLFLMVRQGSGRRASAFAAMLIVPALFESVIGLPQLLTIDAESFISGTYADHSHFAGLLAVALPFAVAGAREGRRWWWIAAGVIFLAIVYSGSRGAVAAIIASLLLYFSLGITRPFPLWKKGVALAAFAVALTLCVLLLWPRNAAVRLWHLQDFTQLETESPWKLWPPATRVIRRYWTFGCGLGAYGHALATLPPVNFGADSRDIDPYVQNDYLQLLAELGVAGCVLVWFVTIRGVIALAQSARHSQTAEGRSWSAASLASIMVFLLQSLVEYNIYVLPNLLAVIWASAIGAAFTGAQRPSKAKIHARTA